MDKEVNNVRKYYGVARKIAATLGFLALFGLSTCDEKPPVAWSAAELEDHQTQIRNVAVAFAIVDDCMPQIDADDEARFELIMEIEAARYTALREFDTTQRLEEIFAAIWATGGTERQRAQVKEAYLVARKETMADLDSLSTCMTTLKAYKNTILALRRSSSR